MSAQRKMDIRGFFTSVRKSLMAIADGVENDENIENSQIFI